MEAKSLEIPGLKLIIPQVFDDGRGYFYESYNKKKLEPILGPIDFVQDNQSCSKLGTLRGLHFQLGKYAQAKLVRVTKGEVLDVAVDIRKDSPTFGKYSSVILSEKNHQQLFIPRGFAHGFAVLSSEAILQYKCDNYYNKESEGSIRFDDPDLKIDWQLKDIEFKLSEKDDKAGSFKEAQANYNLTDWK